MLNTDADLRTDLAGSNGSSLVGFLQAGTGAVGRTTQAKLRETVCPIDFGAVGDGATNDTTAIQATLTYAFANGKGVDGGDLIYGVNSALAFTGSIRPWIRSLRLKQLATDVLVTFKFTNCESIQIERLEIGRGTSSSGDMNSNAGLWIDGGSNHSVRNVTVFGDGDGNGVAIHNTSKSTYESITIRDIEYDAPGAGDDVVRGIWMNANTDCVLVNPVVANLTGNADVTFPSRYTRGIELAGNVRVSVVNPRLRDVDQGVDITGSAGNRQCTVVGGQSYQCVTTAVKLGNSAVDCKIIGHTAERVGQYAFGAGGPTEAGLTYKTKDCDFIGCTAIDVGWNAFPQPHRAFDVHVGDFDLTYPQGIRFIGCRAIDRQAVKTMSRGFYNEVAFDASTKRPNVLIDCVSEGHTTLSETGFHRHLCRVTADSVLSVPNVNTTAIGWTVDTEDTTLMHDPGSNSDRVYANYAGIYRCKTKVVFASNATGFRRIVLQKNGVDQVTNAVAPVNGEVTILTMDELITLAVGDYVSLNAYQSSSGALVLNRTQSFFDVELVRAS